MTTARSTATTVTATATVTAEASSGKTTWWRSTGSPPRPTCGGSWSTGPPAPPTPPSTGSSPSGDRVKIRLVNEMDSDHPMHHPFHLHGAGRFLVLARDGVAEPNLVWKDTVLVRTGQTVDILFDVTNPGLWMAHCHIAEHMQSGMMFSFTVARQGGGPMTAPRKEPAGPGGADDGLLDVVVVGGSQAGLAMAWHLARQRLRFVVLEAGPEIGHTLALALGLPDPVHPRPVRRPARHAVSRPGRTPTRPRTRSPTTCRPTPPPLTCRSGSTPGSPTSAGPRRASRSAPTTTSSAPARWWWRPGRSRCPSCHRPPSGWMRPVTQLHSADYRNPQALPDGPVLVVGGGNSGFQIAEELAAQPARSTCRSAPRRRCCRSGWPARTCSGGSPGWG